MDNKIFAKNLFNQEGIEVIKEYITKLERENKGLKTSLHNRETDLAHYKGYLLKR